MASFHDPVFCGEVDSRRNGSEAALPCRLNRQRVTPPPPVLASLFREKIQLPELLSGKRSSFFRERPLLPLSFRE